MTICFLELTEELRHELSDYSRYGRVEIIRHWLAAQAYKFNYPMALAWSRGNGQVILERK